MRNDKGLVVQVRSQESNFLSDMLQPRDPLIELALFLFGRIELACKPPVAGLKKLDFFSHVPEACVYRR